MKPRIIDNPRCRDRKSNERHRAEKPFSRERDIERMAATLRELKQHGFLAGRGNRPGMRRGGRPGGPPHHDGGPDRPIHAEGRRIGHRRGRVPRGDVRQAVLQLLTTEPMHGYQLMQAIADRTGGRWSPSPGAIYPTISQLEDEGLVTVTDESGRKLVTLTDAGRERAEADKANRTDPFGSFGQAAPGTDLRAGSEEVRAALRQIGRHGSEAQIKAAAKVLAEARKSLYLLLAEGSEASAEDADKTSEQPEPDQAGTEQT